MSKSDTPRGKPLRMKGFAGKNTGKSVYGLALFIRCRIGEKFDPDSVVETY